MSQIRETDSRDNHRTQNIASMKLPKILCLHDGTHEYKWRWG